MAAANTPKLPIEFYVLSEDSLHGILHKLSAVFPSPDWEIDPVTGAVKPQAVTKGDDGRSAYEVAVANGFVGTETQWLASLKGANGTNGLNGATGPAGANGKSAYEIAVAAGFVGTEAQWLASLQGPVGPAGPAGPAADGMTCYVKDNTTYNFVPQSSFPAKVALDGTGSLQETVYNNIYTSGAEADGQYTLRNGANDAGGLTTSYAIAFNFGIGITLPQKIYTQRLNGTAGLTYKAGFKSKDRAGNLARFTFKVLDGATVLATGDTGVMNGTWATSSSGTFTMPAAGFVTLEISNMVNGNASGNDPLLDDIGLWVASGSSTTYKKITQNNVTTYYDSSNNPITGAALTTLLADIASFAVKVTCCTCP